MEKFIEIDKLKNHDMIAGFTAQFIHSEKMTISFWDVKKGSKLPEHSHPHEQISKVLQGEFQFTIDGEEKVMTLGNLAFIPSNAIHSGIALTDCKIMDIFTPCREDYKLD